MPLRWCWRIIIWGNEFEIATVISKNIASLKQKLPEKWKSHEPERYLISIFDAVSLAIAHYYKSE
jgi:hypothetical protein